MGVKSYYINKLANIVGKKLVTFKLTLNNLKKIITLYFILNFWNLAFSQNEKFDSINSIILKIESNKGLSKSKFDYNKLNPILITKGSTIEVWSRNSEILKIRERMQLSWGIFIGVTYFSENKPIKYFEIERNFETDEQNHKKTIQVFKMEYYYLNCNDILNCMKIEGVRKNSLGDIKYAPKAHITPLKYARKTLNMKY